MAVGAVGRTLLERAEDCVLNPSRDRIEALVQEARQTHEPINQIFWEYINQAWAALPEDLPAVGQEREVVQLPVPERRPQLNVAQQQELEAAPIAAPETRSVLTASQTEAQTIAPSPDTGDSRDSHVAAQPTPTQPQSRRESQPQENVCIRIMKAAYNAIAWLISSLGVILFGERRPASPGASMEIAAQPPQAGVRGDESPPEQNVTQELETVEETPQDQDNVEAAGDEIPDAAQNPQENVQPEMQDADLEEIAPNHNQGIESGQYSGAQEIQEDVNERTLDCISFELLKVFWNGLLHNRNPRLAAWIDAGLIVGVIKSQQVGEAQDLFPNLVEAEEQQAPLSQRLFQIEQRIRRNEPHLTGIVLKNGPQRRIVLIDYRNVQQPLFFDLDLQESPTRLTVLRQGEVQRWVMQFAEGWEFREYSVENGGAE